MKPGWDRQKLRVIYFGDLEWGFTDAAIPKLRAVLEASDLPVDVRHSGLTVEFFGEEKRAEFESALALFESLRREPEFQDCKIGVAEGATESFIDVWRVTVEAMTKGKNA